MANRRHVVVVEIEDRSYVDVQNMLQSLDRNGFVYEQRVEIREFPRDQNRPESAATAKKPKANGASALVDNIEENTGDVREMERNSTVGLKQESNDQLDGSTSGIGERRCLETQKQERAFEPLSTATATKPKNQNQVTAVQGDDRDDRDKPMAAVRPVVPPTPQPHPAPAAPRMDDDDDEEAMFEGEFTPNEEDDDQEDESDDDEEVDNNELNAAILESEEEEQDDNEAEIVDEQRQQQEYVQHAKGLARQRRQHLRTFVDKYVDANRTIKCNLCEKRITAKLQRGGIDSTKLYFHAYTHLKKAMYECSEVNCRKKFNTNVAVRNHLLTQHQGGTYEDRKAEFHDDIMTILTRCYDASLAE